MPRARVKLTVKVLATLQPGAIARDTNVPGLFAQAGVDGVSFRIQVDFRAGERTGEARERKTIKRTLGRYPALSIDAARAEAMRLLAEFKEGRNPLDRPAVPAAVWTVEHAFAEYVGNAAKRPGSESTQRDMIDRMKRYLDDWRELPLRDVTREMCAARHLKIAADIKARASSTRTTGARAANTMIRYVSAVWNYAADYTPLPPSNPCRRITMIGEVKAHHEVPLSELAAWWAAVGALKNPLRRSMHRLGLLSGLRPGNLLQIEREWLRLEENRVLFPARVMKGRRPFTLPLSSAMVALAREALAAGDVLEPGSPYLFPSRDGDGRVAPPATPRERAPALKNRTGHALRHTWKTCARLARLPESQIAILMAHRLGGVLDTYGSLEDQVEQLQKDQEAVTTFILARVGAASDP